MTSALALRKAVRASHPSVYAVIRNNEAAFDARIAAVTDIIEKNVGAIMENLSAIKHLLAVQKEMDWKHEDCMKAMELLRRDITTHAECLLDLTSEVRLHKSQLKEYREANNKITAAICDDLNETHAKFPEFRGKLQGEVEKSSAGLATAIKALETRVDSEFTNIHLKLDLLQADTSPTNTSPPRAAAVGYAADHPLPQLPLSEALRWIPHRPPLHSGSSFLAAS